MKTKTKNLVVCVLMGAVLLTMSLWCWFKSPDLFSKSERRTLQQLPEVTAESLLSGSFMTDFESYTLDQFPLRDKFRSIKAFSVLRVFNQKDNGGLYIEDGHAADMEYPMNTDMLDYAAEHFQGIYDRYLSKGSGNIYLSIIPDKNYFLAPESGRLSMDYEAFARYMQEKTPYMEYIDIMPLLTIDDYYRTDSHWKQECITDVAEHLAQEMGVSISADYEINTLETPFYGVYSGQVALPLKADTINYLTGGALDGCAVTSYATGMPAETVVYDLEKAAENDPYDMFLGGADPLVVIDNPNAGTDRELIIFRDSYASSLAPLLTEGYSKITLVDTRYVQSAMLGNLILFDDQDILFLYSTTLLNSSLAMK